MKLDLTNFYINTEYSKYVKELVSYYNKHNMNDFWFTVILVGNCYNIYKIIVKTEDDIYKEIIINEIDIINYIVKYYDRNRIKNTLVFEAYGIIKNLLDKENKENEKNKEDKIYISSIEPNILKDRDDNKYIIEDIKIINNYKEPIILNEYLYYKKIEEKKNEKKTI